MEPAPSEQTTASVGIRNAFLGTGIQLTAVGDTKQRIMGWAGVLEGVFQTFARDFNALSLDLYQNFRSQPRLRRCGAASFPVNAGCAPRSAWNWNC